ncbi:MAG: phosphoadenosine phosphosulfate reductase [Candidatus Methylumidiphilus alinenensis]|uniref:Phosphoadenosine phosphosulfate reductase n=1 Tax=Candidatus Methylumidiphilus alinenensis TaxID=2202197 RepID=A0A2W4QTX0_9GAMM|nr:MAG: phosphoadenosine phosphosulfate reductase [Candidatus Methylumidiphilus alinenensis]
MTDEQPTKPVRHLLGLSGGKDSSALAIYLRDKVPEMEYFFADTGAELPETLAYIDMLEDYLGKPIKRLNSKKSFEYFLKLNGNFLPTAKSRWCTSELKIRPFEEYVGNDLAISYVAIRADESHRKGYLSTKPNISARYPFIEDGVVKEDVLKILETSGIGIPEYYEWRSRSGCYFCFFQRKDEWVGLYERHPEKFEEAKKYEAYHKEHGRTHTWSQGEYLEDLIKRSDEIKANALLQKETEKQKPKKKLLDKFADDSDDGCLICML